MLQMHVQLSTRNKCLFYIQSRIFVQILAETQQFHGNTNTYANIHISSPSLNQCEEEMTIPIRYK